MTPIKNLLHCKVGSSSPNPWPRRDPDFSAYQEFLSWRPKPAKKSQGQFCDVSSSFSTAIMRIHKGQVWKMIITEDQAISVVAFWPQMSPASHLRWVRIRWVFDLGLAGLILAHRSVQKMIADTGFTHHSTQLSPQLQTIYKVLPPIILDYRASYGPRSRIKYKCNEAKPRYLNRMIWLSGLLYTCKKSA